MPGCTERRIIDEIPAKLEDDFYSINYYCGRIYYSRVDGIWKAKPDGTDKRKIINRKPGEYEDELFLYNNRIYIIRQYEKYIESYDLEGKDHKKINVPVIPWATISLRRIFVLRRKFARRSRRCR